MKLLTGPPAGGGARSGRGVFGIGRQETGALTGAPIEHEVRSIPDRPGSRPGSLSAASGSEPPHDRFSTTRGRSVPDQQDGTADHVHRVHRRSVEDGRHVERPPGCTVGRGPADCGEIVLALAECEEAGRAVDESLCVDGRSCRQARRWRHIDRVLTRCHRAIATRPDGPYRRCRRNRLHRSRRAPGRSGRRRVGCPGPAPSGWRRPSARSRPCGVAGAWSRRLVSARRPRSRDTPRRPPRWPAALFRAEGPTCPGDASQVRPSDEVQIAVPAPKPAWKSYPASPIATNPRSVAITRSIVRPTPSVTPARAHVRPSAENQAAASALLASSCCSVPTATKPLPAGTMSATTSSQPLRGDTKAGLSGSGVQARPSGEVHADGWPGEPSGASATSGSPMAKRPPPGTAVTAMSPTPRN